jgi:hypothetical protein
MLPTVALLGIAVGENVGMPSSPPLGVGEAVVAFSPMVAFSLDPSVGDIVGVKVGSPPSPDGDGAYVVVPGVGARVVPLGVGAIVDAPGVGEIVVPAPVGL